MARAVYALGVNNAPIRTVRSENKSTNIPLILRERVILMYTASVITVSDRAAGGTYEDQSGPAVVQLLKEHCYEVIGTIIIPD